MAGGLRSFNAMMGWIYGLESLKRGGVSVQFFGGALVKFLISQLPSSNVDFLQFLSQIQLRN